MCRLAAIFLSGKGRGGVYSFMYWTIKALFTLLERIYIIIISGVSFLWVVSVCGSLQPPARPESAGTTLHCWIMHTDTIQQYFQPSDTVHLQLLGLIIHYTIIHNGRFQIDECHECKWRYDRCTCTIGSNYPDTHYMAGTRPYTMCHM